MAFSVWVSKFWDEFPKLKNFVRLFLYGFDHVGFRVERNSSAACRMLADCRIICSSGNLLKIHSCRAFPKIPKTGKNCELIS